MKAKLIKSLRMNGKIVSPLKNDQVTLVELEEDEFDRLSDMGKVAKPSSDELKIGKLVGQASEGGDDGEKKPAAKTAPKGGKQAGAKPSSDTNPPAGGDTNLDL